MNKDFDFTYLSLGAGVQSTALLAMSALGLYDCPKADCAIFADTQDEPQWVYDHMEFLKTWSPDHGIPIYITTIGKLSEDAIARRDGEKSRFASIPAWTSGSDGKSAPLRRQCTREYKIAPIEKKVRELLGYKPRQRVKESVGAMLGISLEEVIRMKPSRTRWVTNLFPLIEARIRRESCYRIIEDAGIPIPKKSSCVFCPYHSDSFWLDLKNNYPEEFEKAVEFDKEVRDMSKAGVRNPIFIHRSLKPLGEVKFNHEDQMGLFGDGFGNECEGMCGV